MRPRSTSTARPCQRSETSNAGSPVCPFSNRGRSEDLVTEVIVGSGPLTRQPCWPVVPAARYTRARDAPRMEPDRKVSALHHLQNLAHRLGHHLLRHLAQPLLLGLELGHQLREDREICLLD